MTPHDRDPAEWDEASELHDPLDEMGEPMEHEETEDQRVSRIEREATREAGMRYIAFMWGALNYIHEAKGAGEMAIRLWAVSAALDHPACGGRPHSEIAANLGTTRANLSKHIVAFERQNALPPTSSQKSEEARASYSVARKKQLT